ncbi:hypothetical protein BOX15_Mlig012218g1, partial [Macrostomum lignano]
TTMPGSDSDEEYGTVVRSRLKLKCAGGGVESSSKKKRKKKKKNKKRKDKLDSKELQQQQTAPPEEVDTRTAAEKAHARVVEARMAEQLLKRAEKSHKERIMEFNAKLENCSEHFDIPKISWTK